MVKKYTVTDEDVILEDETTRLYRIKALKDFGDVKKGDLGGFIQALDLCDRFFQQVGDFFRGGFVVQLLREFAGGSQVDIELFNDVDRQANGAGLVHDRPFNRLADPPGGVGRETEPAFGIKLLDSPNKAQVALFNQVEQR